MPQGRIVLPNKLREEVIKKCFGMCWYCGKKGFMTKRFGKPVVLERESYKKWINPYDDSFIFEHRAMEFDHIKPLNKGGKDELDNLVIACRACNRKKGDRE